MASWFQSIRHEPRLTAVAIASLLLVVALVTVALTAATPPRAHETLKSTELGVISHRGAASQAPENTLAAVRAGLEQNVDFIEIDLRLTRDRVPVLMHDERVDRTTNGRGAVNTMLSTEVRDLDAGSWFGAEFHDESVPTLDEFLEVFAPARSLAFVELKGEWPDEDIDILVEQLTVENVHDRVVIQSFNESTMRYVSDITPETARVFLTRDIDQRTIELVHELDIDGIGAQLAVIEVEREKVRALKKDGVGTFAYTLNDEIAWEAAEVAGVDLIVTDNAAELQEWLDR